ncbi:3-methyladenine DNA glycosylase [Sulfurospirillum barnesii]|uniref:Putative endonuclease III-like protein n=1 Tax=Sulfurospirillum barnesii (strain ATCC 700032 / DSM 10660 / SES-3) TaxID=760154 RepID=I3XYE2_SULBS|nr:3-methyladenine DNA glycosylase [Sulfurospirillum barnesii]AFL68966.1 putative endonuclease III-like protein [Sulfurospirillum barnesii SES-3]
MNSFELLVALKHQGYIKTTRDALWWPRSRTFWVVVGAILTQQSKWENVEKSIENLESLGVDSLEKLATLRMETLVIAIQPSGFYHTKAKNLHQLATQILDKFGSFDFFCEHVSREWLLDQKGIGEESADAILCYACQREVLVVDAYTARLVKGFGYEFESYQELQAWMQEGVLHHFEKIQKLYSREMSVAEVYARFHGKIVEFCKQNSKGKVVDIGSLSL